MLTRDQILQYFDELNEILRSEGQKGEIGIVGGTVMCLVYNARAATKDVHAIFEPSAAIRKAAKRIAERHHLSEDWLNDGAKSFLVSQFKREVILTRSHLTIWAPEGKYMLAMKCISARWDSSDKDDVIYLINHLKLKAPQVVFDIIRHYYPKERIPAKTQYFIEELFDHG